MERFKDIHSTGDIYGVERRILSGLVIILINGCKV